MGVVGAVGPCVWLSRLIYAFLFSPHTHTHTLQACLGRRPARTELLQELDDLLSGMLARARQGHTDGTRAPTQGSTALSPVPRHVWAMVGGEDVVFTGWLRAVNDKMMRGQLAACHAILEAIEEAEGGEVEEGEEGGERGGADVQAYMAAWGLDALLLGGQEDGGAAAAVGEGGEGEDDENK